MCRTSLSHIWEGLLDDQRENMSEVLQKLSQEVNHAVNENLEGVQDYVNITLQVSFRS